jgi:hypothetical protein
MTTGFVEEWLNERTRALQLDEKSALGGCFCGNGEVVPLCEGPIDVRLNLNEKPGVVAAFTRPYFHLQFHDFFSVGISRIVSIPCVARGLQDSVDLV